MKSTAMGAAFVKAGMIPRQMRLYKPIMEFIAEGGTEDELLAVYRACAKPGKGHGCSAIGLMSTAQPRLPHEDAAGQPYHADNGLKNRAPASSPYADGGGQSLGAKSADALLPPVRTPTAEQQQAVEATRKLIALNAFDRELTRTGQRWGNVHYCDLDSMHEDGELALAIRHHLGLLKGEDRMKRLRDLMTPRQFSQLLNKHRKARAA